MSTWIPRPNCLDPQIIVAGRAFPLDDDVCRLVAADALDEDGQLAAAALMRRLDLCVCAPSGHHVGLAHPRVLRVGVSGSYRIVREYVPSRRKRDRVWVWRSMRKILPVMHIKYGMMASGKFYTAYPKWQSSKIVGSVIHQVLNADEATFADALAAESLKATSPC